MSIYYSNPDWPELSPADHEELIAYVHQSPTDLFNKSVFGYHHYLLPPRLEHWCRNNLPINDRHKIVIQRFFSPDISFVLPKHIDGQRTETFNYLLSPSGAITRWFNNNIVVESVVFERYKWAKLKVDTLHDVINNNTERIAISIFIPNIEHHASC